MDSGSNSPSRIFVCKQQKWILQRIDTCHKGWNIRHGALKKTLYICLTTLGNVISSRFLYTCHIAQYDNLLASYICPFIASSSQYGRWSTKSSDTPQPQTRTKNFPPKPPFPLAACHHHLHDPNSKRKNGNEILRKLVFGAILFVDDLQCSWRLDLNPILSSLMTQWYEAFIVYFSFICLYCSHAFENLLRLGIIIIKNGRHKSDWRNSLHQHPFVSPLQHE